MKFGFVYPHNDILAAVDCAVEAEAHGWDGFFVWEGIWGMDAWVTLAAAAVKTQTIRLGTMITPVSRRRPWKLASETATIDRLSNGRVILAVGLGALDTGFADFGEETDRKKRAELLDEGLEIIAGLWNGQPFSFEGRHYHVRENNFFPPPKPVQQPRIPVWVVGAWPRQKSVARTLRWDGILPVKMPVGSRKIDTLQPQDVADIHAYAHDHGKAPGSYDIVVEGITPGRSAAKAAGVVLPWANAGATWWIEALWEAKNMDAVIKRVRQGPPRI